MTTNTHFENKEHYLAFRKAWSNAVNSNKAKKKIETRTWTYGSTTSEYDIAVKGWTTGAHMIAYNMLRGRDYDRGFTLVTNRNKLMNGTSPNLGLFQAVTSLKRNQKWIREEAIAQENGKDYSWSKNVSEFLAPFDGTVTREMIMALEIPECKQLYRDFGPGMKVIPLLISGDANARTQTDLETLLKEVA